MADSVITKKSLAAALKQELKEKPFSKISIGDICAQCQMNRKSFYYHFRDKYDLVNWIFACEFLSVFPASDDPWQNMEHLCRYFYENRDFYRKVLRIKGQNCFGEYFHALCVDAFCRKLGRGEQSEFCAAFYADACLCTIERWLCARECTPPQDFVARLRGCLPLPTVD